MPGGTDEHSGVVFKERSDSLALHCGQGAVELQFKGRTVLPLVFNLQCHAVLAQQLCGPGYAAPWQRDALSKLVSESDDPGCGRGG